MHISYLAETALQPLFLQLSAVLKRYQPYWQFSVMDCPHLPWSAALNAHLLALNEAQLQALDQSPALQLAEFEPFFPELASLPQLLDASDKDLASWPFWLTNGINGRKVTQIQQFCQFIPEHTLPVVEWCAGKGHLGRLLAAQRGCQVTSIEWQAALCAAGQALATQFQLPQQFKQADVLSPEGSALLTAKQQVLALHACGQLHVQLLKQAVAKGCQQLHIAPCCYHLIPDGHYQPLSSAGQRSGVTLTRDELKLAVQGQVTAGERVARLRQTEVSWRLAYETWRREQTGQATYQPLNSLPKHWFSGSFADFMAMAAAQHQLKVTTATNWQPYLAAGQQRYALVQRLDAVRHVFRRPLELFLVLDRALYLQEQGYQVSVRAFCDYQLTPRNLLLQAERRHATV